MTPVVLGVTAATGVVYPNLLLQFKALARNLCASAMPLNLKISWGGGASSARLMGLEDGITLGGLKALISTKSGIDPAW